MHGGLTTNPATENRAKKEQDTISLFALRIVCHKNFEVMALSQYTHRVVQKNGHTELLCPPRQRSLNVFHSKMQHYCLFG